MINNHMFQKSNNIKKVKSYGPVSILEEYVQPDWWKIIFNSTYIKTDGDVVENQNITKNEIDYFLNILKLKKEDKILDLCCGQGRHAIELAKRGFYNIEGLDSSHYLIQKARNRSNKENLNIKFKEGNARKLPYETDTFDVVLILGNSFGYFETIHDDLRVLSEIFRILKPRGKLLIDVADGEYLKNNYQARSWERIDKKNFVCRERSLSIDKQKLISREVVTHIENGVIADQFYAERLYSEKSMIELLKLSGFKNTILHGIIETDSERNQDLGMMEKRLIFTSIAIKEWTNKKKSIKQKLKNVIVLLGDPNKSDEIKPSSFFDEDDFYTIDRLKDALNELKEFKFNYLSDHEFLINELIKKKNKIDYVFNLCDEGFFNDPKKELHITSILEMLNIQYTGSGPQCLAYCYDKSLIRGIAKEMEIPVPKAFFINPEDTAFDIPFELPVIIKPNCGDSSFGITQRSVAKNAEEGSYVVVQGELRRDVWEKVNEDTGEAERRSKIKLKAHKVIVSEKLDDDNFETSGDETGLSF